MNLKLILVGVTLACSSTPVMASQFFRWVDEDGVLHFDTEKPEGVDASIKQVDPNAGKKQQKHYANGCKTEKCQRNMERLLGKQLPKTSPSVVAKPKPIAQKDQVVKLSPTDKKTKSQSTMQRFLSHKAQKSKQTTVKTPVVKPQLAIPKNYTLISPNKKNQEKVRAKYGANPDNAKRDKNQAVMNQLFKSRNMYFNH